VAPLSPCSDRSPERRSGSVYERPAAAGRGRHPEQWFYARLALMIMFGASTMVALWLWVRASREIRDLGLLATEARLEAARQAREEKDKKKGRRRR